MPKRQQDKFATPISIKSGNKIIASFGQSLCIPLTLDSPSPPPQQGPSLPFIFNRGSILYKLFWPLHNFLFPCPDVHLSDPCQGEGRGGAGEGEEEREREQSRKGGEDEKVKAKYYFYI